MTCYGNGLALNGGGGGCLPYGFFAYRSSNLALTSGVENVAIWTNKRDENPVGMMNLTTDIATIPIEGWWTFTCSLELVLAARGSFQVRWYKNGTYQGGDGPAIDVAGTLIGNASIVDYFSLNETIEVRAFQNSGFAATLQGCCNQLFFSGALICHV